MESHAAPEGFDASANGVEALRSARIMALVYRGVMRSSSRALTLLAACSLVTVVGCDLLKKLKKGDDDGGLAEAGVAAATASATTTASSPSAVAAASSAPTTPDAPVSDVKLPGACVDPKVDVKKRKSGNLALDESIDLDGDGTKDRVYRSVVSIYVGDFITNYLYVMRGACGHFVGDPGPSQGWRLTGQKSQGLKSFELTYAEHCESACDCVTRTASLTFDGTKYVTGKVGKDIIVKPCAGAKDAGATTNAAAFAVGDKLNVEWKGKTYPATVIGVAGPDKYRIHYDGYESSWDEVVGPSRIRGRR
jgi:hypothetical protein